MSASRILQFRVRNIKRKFPHAVGAGSGPKGRIMMLRNQVTELFRHERVEIENIQIADETRGYAERLIQEAVRHGSQNEKTMDQADYWLLEKDLVPKLFEVFVPRYQNYDISYTSLFRLPVQYPGSASKTRCILELKGNPWPPVVPRSIDHRYSLPNILLHELKKEYRQEKAAKFYSQEES